MLALPSRRAIALAAIVVAACAPVAPVASPPASAETPSEPVVAVASAASSAKAAAPPADVASSSCASIPDLPQLAVLGGRPYGVFPAGVRRLDRPGDPVTPLGADWPIAGGDALGDRPGDLRGSWPDRLTVQMGRQKGNFPGTDAYLLDHGRWRRLADPKDIVGYLRVVPAGNGRVVGIGVMGFTTRLVVLAGPDRFPGADVAYGAGGCELARTFDLAVSPGGRVAVTRERCTDQGTITPVQVEVFDQRLRSQTKTPLEKAESLAFIAWLDDETRMAMVTEGAPPGVGRLVRITRGKATDLPLARGEIATGLSRTADGELLVMTTQRLLRVGRDGGLEGAATPWPVAAGLRADKREFVHQIAIGEDGAAYLEIVGSVGPRVVRCRSLEEAPAAQ